MIDPSQRDIGRQVLYRGFSRHPDERPEIGQITSFNARFVFVRYGHDEHSKATRRQDLEWKQ